MLVATKIRLFPIDIYLLVRLFVLFYTFNLVCFFLLFLFVGLFSFEFEHVIKKAHFVYRTVLDSYNFSFFFFKRR